MEKIKYKSLSDFLSKHYKDSTSKAVQTHTRIRKDKLNIKGGSYSIAPEELSEFFYLYYQHIWINNQPEYITEKQIENGPLLVDFDFRYSCEVERRIHTEWHVDEMIETYMKILLKCFVFTEDKIFDIFIMEKPNVNRIVEDDVTKDGIHMLIGIQIDHTMQEIIREMALKELPNVWSDLPLKNTFDSVLDDRITKGKNNWQLFGSKKPGHEAYELTMHYEMRYTKNTDNFEWNQKKPKEFDLKNQFYKLSAQNEKNPKFDMNPSIISLYEDRKNNLIKKSIVPANRKKLIVEMDDEEGTEYVSLEEITNKEMLDKATKYFLEKMLEPHEYKIKEIHLYTQILPEKYYQPGSHILNREVAFALKNMDNRLFLSWIGLRSKAEDFRYQGIPDLYKLWNTFSNSSLDGKTVTFRSIIYWAKQDATEEYIKIKEETMDHVVEQVIVSPTSWDMAMLQYQLYKDKFVCSNIKDKTWYMFENHKWKKDNGFTIRMSLSKEICNIFDRKRRDVEAELINYDTNNDRQEYLEKKMASITDIMRKLKSTTDKNNIFREAMEIFYDSDFTKKLDTNPYLLCFNDGVIDFNTKTFRDGYPTDYISMSTNHNYILTKDDKYHKTVEEINKMMKTIFTKPDVLEYMWDHLASSLIGKNLNQTFTIYKGTGANGKSILVNLMKHTLGDYHGIMPITLITEKRTASGGTCSELAQLKGKRYAALQEPTDGMRLNEGIMKEITGGDQMQVRELYETSSTFDPQFKLVLCCNNLLEISDNGDGTWRRIRLVDFISKFVGEGETHTDKKDIPVFPKDPELESKLPDFSPVFLNMLVERVFETEGKVKDCDTVLEASNGYRKEQDMMSQFFLENVEKFPGGSIQKSVLNQTFKQWVDEIYGDKKRPKNQKLYDYMDKVYSKFNTSKKKWLDVRIVPPDQEEANPTVF
jgi:P4 family phage/plasmid primase-like protien